MAAVTEGGEEKVCIVELNGRPSTSDKSQVIYSRKCRALEPNHRRS